MFTPNRKAWPGWSPLFAEPREKRKLSAPLGPNIITEGRELSPVKGLITSLEANGAFSTQQSESEVVWERFKEAGSLDEGSIAMKDRSSLMAHISKLESELYDYQYNMGLLLMERKEWGSKMEKLKASAQDAEENLRRELAAHLIAISEAEKREEALKMAIGVERQRVYDLEKVVKDMRAESDELKHLAGNKLNEAQELISGTTEKALQAESKLHAADVLLAELSRKQGIADRKLQDVEAQEDILRRERLAFKAQQEANEEELNRQRQSLYEWEKKLQDGQSRLLEGQKLLNQTEDVTNKKECALKKMEIDLLAMKQQIETERSLLQQSEADRMSKISGLAIREEIAVKNEIALAKKEQELLLLQEKISSRERLLEQHQEHVKATEILVSKERERVEVLENAVKQREAALPEKHQNLIELQMSVEQQREEAKSKKEECEKLLTALQLQKQELMEEEVRLRVTEQERLELLKLQTCLKEEIDDFRGKKKVVLMEAEELKREKERFEKEWELLDEKRECLQKELEKADLEAHRVAEWLRIEEARLKEERRLLQNQIQRESEALRIEKEDFTRRMEHERAEWFSSVEKEKEDLVRDLERKSGELEKSIEKKREEIEKQLGERELKMKRDLERRRENIAMQIKLAEKQLDDVKLEKLELDKMREEIARQREESENQWVEIRKDINELQVQREKLKEQREALSKEREENLQEAEILRKLRLQLKAPNASQQCEEWEPPSNGDKMLTPCSDPDVPQTEADDTDILFSTKLDNKMTPGKLKESPVRFSWLQKCVSGLLLEKRSAFKENIKDQEESNASPGADLNNKQLDTGSDGEGKLGFDQASRSSASITPSTKKGKQTKVQKTREQGVKRTHSIAATVADARLILKPHFQQGNEAWINHRHDGLKMRNDNKLLDSGARSAIEQDKDTISDKQVRKRVFSQANDIVSEAETEDTEVESEITTRGRKKQRQTDHGISVSSDLRDTPGMKRYNFRRSTVTKTGASKISTDAKDKPIASQEIRDLQDVSSAYHDAKVRIDDPLKDQVASDKVNNEVVLQEEMSIFRYETSMVDTRIEQGRQCSKRSHAEESEERENEYVEDENIDEDLDMGDGSSELDNMQEIREEDGKEEKPSLKQKWWDYLTT